MDKIKQVFYYFPWSSVNPHFIQYLVAQSIVIFEILPH